MEEQYYSLAIFQKLPKDYVSALFKLGKLMNCAAEASIYPQGSTLAGIYIVLNGHVKLCRQSEKHRQVLALLRLGDSFGIETLSDSPLAAYGAESIDEAKILFVPTNVILSTTAGAIWATRDRPTASATADAAISSSPGATTTRNTERSSVWATA